MLPTIDFQKQLAQLQSQLNTMGYNPQSGTAAYQFDKNYCPHRLPCGLCSQTNSFCGMQTTEVTCSTNEVSTNG